MKKFSILLIALLVVLGFLAPLVSADDTLARFKGGIGVIPVSNVTVSTDTTPVVTVNRNIVRGVAPAGQIWVIEDLDARVRMNGDIRVNGKGLIFGGGNNTGRATGQNVIATLVCEDLVQRSTSLPGVPLADNGDFRIDDVLTPWPPDNCDDPRLLIRNAGGTQGWFAAGILKFKNDMNELSHRRGRGQ